LRSCRANAVSSWKPCPDAIQVHMPWLVTRRKRQRTIGDLMEIKDWTLKEFRRHAREYWPQACKAHALPTSGCIQAVERWLKTTGIGITAFIDKVKTATGDRSLALYQCAARGWIPRAEAVELIKSAPGNRAWVLRLCVYQDWLTYEEVETYLEAQYRSKPGHLKSLPDTPRSTGHESVKTMSCQPMAVFRL
jgi:hypothetical protein